MARFRWAKQEALMFSDPLSSDLITLSQRRSDVGVGGGLGLTRKVLACGEDVAIEDSRHQCERFGLFRVCDSSAGICDTVLVLLEV